MSAAAKTLASLRDKIAQVIEDHYRSENSDVSSITSVDARTVAELAVELASEAVHSKHSRNDRSHVLFQGKTAEELSPPAMRWLMGAAIAQNDLGTQFNAAIADEAAALDQWKAEFDSKVDALTARQDALLHHLERKARH